MRNLKLTFCALLIFHSTSVQSQKPVIEIGETVTLDKKDYAVFSSYSDAAVYMVKVEKEKRDRYATLYAYSRQDLKQVFSFPVVIPPVDAEAFRIHSLDFYNGKLNLFYSYYNVKDKMNRLLLTTYDQSGKPIDSGKEILKSDADKENKTGYFITQFNKETGNTVCMHFIDKTVAGESLVTPDVQIAMISAAGEIKYQKKLKLSDDDHFELAAITSDKQGNAYIAIYPYIMQVYKKPNRLFVFDAATQEVTNHDMVKSRITGKEKLVRRGIFSIDKNNNVFYFDQYSPNLNGDAIGIYAAKYSSQTKTLKSSFIAFNEPEPDEAVKKSGNYKLINYNFREIKIFDDNSLCLYLEKAFTLDDGYRNSSNYMQAIINTDLNSLKQQYFGKEVAFFNQEAGFTRTIPINQNGFSCVLFNSDLKENKDGKIITKPTAKKDNLKGCYAVFPKVGEAQIIKLSNELSSQTFLFFADSYIKTDKDEVFSLCEVGGQFKVCKIYLK